jgi:Ca2+-binding EF-hand superfamily protein
MFLSRQMLSDGETEDLRHMFQSLDTNGDGTLSREEIRLGLGKNKALDDEELDEVLAC